jgi:hypothetical protein
VTVFRTVGQTSGGDQGELHWFRTEVYDCLDRRADAVFELVHGDLCAGRVAGVAYLSLAPGVRRGPGAGYAALTAGRIDEDLLRDVLAAYRPRCWRLDFAMDASVGAL